MVERTEAIERGRREPLSEQWSGFVEQAVRTLPGIVRRTGVTLAANLRWDEIEDLVQEVWCRLLAQADRGALPRVGANRQRWAYLNRVARSVIVDHGRRSRAAKRGGDRFHCSVDELPEELWHAAGAGARSAEDELLLREMRSRLLDSCRGVVGGPRVGRDAFIVRLAWVEGWTADEISRRLGGALGPSGVSTVLHRARTRLARAGGAGRSLGQEPA